MSTSNKVWVRVSVLKLASNPEAAKKQIAAKKKAAAKFSVVTETEYDWALANVLSRKPSEKEGAEDLTVQITDESVEDFNGSTIEVPAAIAGEGGIAMANENTFSDAENENPLETLPPKDLINLVHLHEPAVVYCLQRSFESDKIYTATGPILLAVNPFARLPGTYDEECMQRYYEHGASANPGDAPLPPHVFGNADVAFRAMMNAIKEEEAGNANGDGFKVDQAILVSGESGAGKTVSTKFIMKYLASLSKRSAADKAKEPNYKASSTGLGLDVESKVLQSNPILESFGNARTVRNDNSSRFGKFIELQFKSNGTLIGAAIETYLLEKIRLVHQSANERNYHVFYELLEGGSDELLSSLSLSDYSAEDFKITSMSGTYNRRDGVPATETYNELNEAFDVMGFDDELQNDIFKLVASFLHISNITFDAVTADECKVNKDNPHLKPLLALLGVEEEAFNTAMVTSLMKVGGRSIQKFLSKDKAEKGVEAFIKGVYSTLYNFLVDYVNNVISFDPKKHKDKKIKKAGYIGVLDIFGFESFKTNSYEQLCINYCNEALQQQFNLFVFTNEQKEYEREGIKWSFIQFPDNKDILELIDKPKAGIISVLDDQCRAPGTSDKSFTAALYKQCKEHKRFSADSRQVGKALFGIYHYAGPVEYMTEGFLEKNKDEMPKQATDLLLSSTNGFVKKLAIAMEPPAEKSTTGRPKKKQTVGGQFVGQLNELRKRIDKTHPHYVRCLKPNSQLVPGVFTKLMIADQLKCAGVLEAVRVSRVGFPQRYPHAHFVERYRILSSKSVEKMKNSGSKAQTDVLVASVLSVMSKSGLKDEDGIQIGRTKVFLRSSAFEYLEKCRGDIMASSALIIQTRTRGYLLRIKYRRAIRAVITFQGFNRIVIAKKLLLKRRRKRASTKIQTFYRMNTLRYYYKMTVCIGRWCQRIQRGRTGRKRYERLNRERKSILIQKYWRWHMYSQRFQKMKAATHLLQCAVRVYQARMVLKKYRAAARNMGLVKEERNQLKKENEKIKDELAVLKKKLSEEADKNAVAMAAEKTKVRDEMEALKNEVLEKSKELESSQKALIEAGAFEKEVEQLKAEILTTIEKGKAETVEAVSSATEALRQELNAEKDIIQGKADQLQIDLDDKSEELQKAQNEIESLNEKEQLNEKSIKELTDSLSTKEAEVSNLSDEVSKMNEVIAATKTELETRESEVEAALSEVAELKEKEQVSTEERNSLTDKLNGITDEFETFKDSKEVELCTLNEEWTKVKEIANNLEEQLQEKNEEIIASQESLAALKDQHQAENDSLREAIDQIKTNFENKENELRNAQQEIETLNEKGQLNEKTTTDLTDELVLKGNEINNLNAELEKNKEEVTQTAQKLQAKETEVEDALTEVAELKEKELAFSEKNCRLTNELNSLNEEFTSYKDAKEVELCSVNDEVAKLNETRITLEENLEKKNGELINSQELSATMQEEFNKEKDALQEKANLMTKSLEEKETELDNIQNELGLMKEKEELNKITIQNFTDKLDTKENEIAAISEELDKTKEKITSTSEQLKTKESEVESVLTELEELKEKELASAEAKDELLENYNKLTDDFNALKESKESEIVDLNKEVTELKETASVFEEKLHEKDEELLAAKDLAASLQDQNNQLMLKMENLEDSEEKKEIDMQDDFVPSKQYEEMEIEKMRLEDHVNALMKELEDMKINVVQHSKLNIGNNQELIHLHLRAQEEEKASSSMPNTDREFISNDNSAMPEIAMLENTNTNLKESEMASKVPELQVSFDIKDINSMDGADDLKLVSADNVSPTSISDLEEKQCLLMSLKLDEMPSTVTTESHGVQSSHGLVVEDAIPKPEYVNPSQASMDAKHVDSSSVQIAPITVDENAPLETIDEDSPSRELVDDVEGQNDASKKLPREKAQAADVYDGALLDELTKRDKTIEKLLAITEKQSDDMRRFRDFMDKMEQKGFSSDRSLSGRSLSDRSVSNRSASNRSVSNRSVSARSVTSRTAVSRKNGTLRRAPAMTCNWNKMVSGILGNSLLSQTPSSRFV